MLVKDYDFSGNYIESITHKYAISATPIPLGLETDSLAMLFATPICLYAESNEEYDNVDLVQHHFSVGTENGVSWASGNRLSIDGGNAIILASGN